MSGLLRLTSPLLTRVRRATAAPSPARHAARRPPARPRAVASDASTGSDDAATVPLSRSEVIVTSTAVRLASYVYKAGDLEPWVSRDGFVLRAQGVTPCTRWFVCDKIEPAGDAKRAEAATPAGDSSAAPALSSSPSGASASSREDDADADANSDSESESERAGGVVAQRWFIVRGAAWNDDAVDSLQLSANIAKMWPAPLHPAVPVVCHAGVSEMTEAFWPEIAPLAASAPATARLCFAGHSLGGSMATLLMAWTKLRLGVDPARMDPAITFGSPPTLAVDRWALRNADAGASVERVARAAAGGEDWVGELMNAVGVGELTRGVVGGITPAGGGGGGGGAGANGERTRDERTRDERTRDERTGDSSAAIGDSGDSGDSNRPGTESSPAPGTESALALAGFAPDAVRAFVLSNDPVPRMWLAADPAFSAAIDSDLARSVLGARERLFGAGIFSSRRFLYEAVGALYWLRWSANEGTALTVHDEASEALAERLRIETEEGESAGSAAFRGAWDHNAQNYVDAVQWIALKTLVNSTSRSL